jgi:hypothetical protein
MQVAGTPFRRDPKQVINIHAESFPWDASQKKKLSSMIARIVTFPKMT